MDSGRFFLHSHQNQNQTLPKLYHRGLIYDLQPGETQAQALYQAARHPELLNQREAELALVLLEPEGRCRLVRDFGPTPLYYALDKDCLVWSFSYKGLLALLDFVKKPQPDQATMFDYIATHYRYIFRDPGRTFHQGVRQVPAGSYVDIDLKGCQTHSWLDLQPDPNQGIPGPEEAAEGLMSILKENVGLRCRAAVNPAFTVSSGLDSSTVASLAAEHLGDIDIFSVGYEGDGVEEYDETAGVAELTAGKDWHWNNLVLKEPDLVSDTKKLIALTQSPVVTVTWLAYYLMTKQLGGFSHIFNGLGGDECLAGEYAHFFYFFADLKQNEDEVRLQQEVAAWSRLHDHPVFHKNTEVLQKFWERNIDFNTGEMKVDPHIYEANRRFFDENWFREHGAVSPPMPRPFPGFLSNRLYQEFVHETTPPTLWGLFMAHELQGLTGVSPFLSPRLFRFSWGLPSSIKYDQGLTKALLRRGLKGILPEKTRLNHQKTGFNAPLHRWFNQPKVARETLELLTEGPLARQGWLKKDAAKTIIQEHQNGQANHMMLLWTLLNTALFLE